MASDVCKSKICSCTERNKRNAETKGKLTIQCDELWSFVNNKGNKQWVWLALDANTREIVGVYVGDWLGHCAERNRARRKLEAKNEIVNQRAWNW